jgi:hypothetical protein
VHISVYYPSVHHSYMLGAISIALFHPRHNSNFYAAVGEDATGEETSPHARVFKSAQEERFLVDTERLSQAEWRMLLENPHLYGRLLAEIYHLSLTNGKWSLELKSPPISAHARNHIVPEREDVGVVNAPVTQEKVKVLRRKLRTRLEDLIRGFADEEAGTIARRTLVRIVLVEHVRVMIATLAEWGNDTWPDITQFIRGRLQNSHFGPEIFHALHAPVHVPGLTVRQEDWLTVMGSRLSKLIQAYTSATGALHKSELPFGSHPPPDAAQISLIGSKSVNYHCHTLIVALLFYIPTSRSSESREPLDEGGARHRL